MSVQMYFLLFVMYSVMGWVMEILVTFVKNHKFVNRGFLIGPYCPIYGFGVLLMMLLLTKYLDKPLLFFIMAIIVCTIFEYLTSFLMEKMFNARWWDYSNSKFNINGRVYLNNMIAFGVLAVIIFYFVNPLFVRIIEFLTPNGLNILSISLFIIIISDYVMSFLIIKNFSTTVKNAKYDNTEEITKYVKEVFLGKSYLARRLIKAYPHFKTKIKLKFAEVKDKIQFDE